MDKQLTHQGEPTLPLHTITEGQIRVNPISAFQRVCVCVIHRQLCIPSPVLFIHHAVMIECGGWDKIESCGHPIFSSLSSLQLTVDAGTVVPPHLFQLTLDKKQTWSLSTYILTHSYTHGNISTLWFQSRYCICLPVCLSKVWPFLSIHQLFLCVETHAKFQFNKM